jgi:ABC-type nitrate/sulfonate/bicarbonate transport system substrate-binding protein
MRDMKRNKTTVLRILKKSKPLMVGFLPENDCAPLVMAQELGLYTKYGLSVELRREVSWRNIQDKVVHRRLDAGHVPAALPFLMNLGLTPEKCPSVTGLVLSLQGNAITLSRELWNRGVRDPQSLREQIVRERRPRTYTFGVSCPLASQYALMCQWLRAADIPPSTEIRIMPVPPSQVFPMLKLGCLDGYCAGEPWTSVAVQAGVGVCVATSASLAPLHPEKVLLVRKDFAEKRADEHERLIAALLEACRYCDQPENRNQICELLALPCYVNAPPSSASKQASWGPLDPRMAEFVRCMA